VVSLIEIVVLPFVIVAVLVIGVPNPQFPVKVISADVVGLGAKFVNISSIAVFESWQFWNETVLWKTIWQRLRELELFANNAPKSEVIATVESAGIELSDRQSKNNPAKLVTLEVFNSGND
jgi:hypothetical protein